MRFDIRHIAMAISLAVAFIMLGGKLTAFYLTGSTAILSDALESIVHVAATAIAAFSLWYAQQPASREHPYGYGKAAYFSAGFEGALILLAALFTLYVGFRDLILGPELQRLGWGLLITGVLAIVNLALGGMLVWVGKRHNALILVSNGKHVLTDMWTSAGVVLGVGLVWLTDILWLDPLVAIVVGGNIFVTAAGLMRRSFRGLLDSADPERTAALLRTLNEAVANGEVSSYHQVRHRQSNDQIFIELHLMFPEDVSIKEAHDRVTSLELRIRQCFPEFNVHVTAHMEPASHDTAHPAGHESINDPLAEGEAEDTNGGTIAGG